jgi:hypothetical protein
VLQRAAQSVVVNGGASHGELAAAAVHAPGETHAPPPIALEPCGERCHDTRDDPRAGEVKNHIGERSLGSRYRLGAALQRTRSLFQRPMQKEYLTPPAVVVFVEAVTPSL